MTRDNEAGYTLAEAVVTMVITAIFMGISTTSIISLYSATNRAQAIADGQAQIGVAFGRLDRQIRYASGLSTPGLVNGEPYVEYVTTYTGTPICTQLRVRPSTGQLQQRSWTQGTSTVTPTAWTQLAGDVSSPAPFTVSTATATFTFQRLSVRLTATTGGAAVAVSRQFGAAFTALNTSLNTQSATVCAEGRAVP
ncbi:type II secretion system protein J [Cryptosporangium sp. NPDC051539]|uniref:type II secretion system protein J n=1 Tax=Cryptosporangium sp. NPDC051539 TaxID=3363962 RepID=UPI0037A613F2